MSFRVAILLFACFAAGLSQAMRLDDSASPRARIELKTRWSHEGSAAVGDQAHSMIAEARNFEVRLNTASTMGKKGRIWLVLPESMPGLLSSSAMRLSWQTRGLFKPGIASPGQRALLFEGVIAQAQLREFLDFTIEIDTRFITKGFRFEPQFEFDPLP